VSEKESRDGREELKISLGLPVSVDKGGLLVPMTIWALIDRLGLADTVGQIDLKKKKKKKVDPRSQRRQERRERRKRTNLMRHTNNAHIHR
jgi:hypothetical protein